MAFEDTLKKLRLSKGLTQEELAKETGLAKSSISMYESGRRKPSFEVLEAFADFFNVDMNTLWEIPPTDYLFGEGGAAMHESFTPYGKNMQKETDLDNILTQGGYLTYSNKPLTEQQKHILREFVKVLIKEESSDAETTSDSH